jgi:hypothetical protein
MTKQTFPDGAHYRIEISGIETATVLEAVVDEARKKKIPIHRAIATVAGSMHYSDEQLKDLAHVAAENEIEVIICPGNLARGLIEDPNKLFTMMNWQNRTETDKFHKEIMRCAKLGFRGFLFWRKGMLLEWSRRRSNEIHPGINPLTAVFKLSTFDNNANLYDFQLAEQCGANTINTVNNLTPEALAYLRKKVSVPFDIHITFWELDLTRKNEIKIRSYDRIEDAPDLVKAVSPCYLKFEKGLPGISVYDLSGPKWTEKDLAKHKRKDVRTAAWVVKNIKRTHPHLKLSPWGPADLKIPVV